MHAREAKRRHAVKPWRLIAGLRLFGWLTALVIIQGGLRSFSEGFPTRFLLIHPNKRTSTVRFCPNERGPPTYRCSPAIVNSTGMLTFETVLGLNFHVRTVLRTDLSSSGLPVLCAIEALVTRPLAG